MALPASSATDSSRDFQALDAWRRLVPGDAEAALEALRTDPCLRSLVPEEDLFTLWWSLPCAVAIREHGRLFHPAVSDVDQFERWETLGNSDHYEMAQYIEDGEEYYREDEHENWGNEGPYWGEVVERYQEMAEQERKAPEVVAERWQSMASTSPAAAIRYLNVLSGAPLDLISDEDVRAAWRRADDASRGSLLIEHAALRDGFPAFSYLETQDLAGAIRALVAKKGLYALTDLSEERREGLAAEIAAAWTERLEGHAGLAMAEFGLLREREREALRRVPFSASATEGLTRWRDERLEMGGGHEVLFALRLEEHFPAASIPPVDASQLPTLLRHADARVRLEAIAMSGRLAEGPKPEMAPAPSAGLRA